MKSKLEKAMEYIRGYCIKHSSCEDCKLNSDELDGCCIKKIPCDWKTPSEMKGGAE